MKKALFVSFASVDDPAVQTVCATLERDGISCWNARRDVAPGANWGRSIIEAIDDCPAMLLMLSTAANESVHVANEVERCVSKGKQLYVARLEDVKPSPTLELYESSRQWTDVWRAPIEPAIRALASTVREKLGLSIPDAQLREFGGELSPKDPGTAWSKLAGLAAKTASRTQGPVIHTSTDVAAVIAQALAQIDAKESGSMGSFYMDEGNLRTVYRSMRDQLKGVSDERSRAALASHLDDDDPLTKWKA